ncbi:polysaccharide deacetylase family protein [Campylobacter geochelonis]|uniref:Polysaccharide deacetylase n=1 Tax=Campylobacter geochelonis TaxID=1780362 RepID=A0A128EK05_9BACT|nr:polysaccharide deacetylase family protein [Campylobacter geochelonis]QKF71547.1 polysaccharide deacetylase [Campylobacter geochelonis]CZE49086.1 polysaccharide deacetylase [Campylobacter geochelonis]
MIYILILLIIGFIIFSFRFAWWAKNISYEYPRVLMYHMISRHLPKNKSKFNRLRVKPNEFEKQLCWLKKNGFSSYTLSELILLEKIPLKSVVITFDDGYKDNFTNALPLLQKYGFKATIFIVNNRFDGSWATDKDLNKKSDELNSEEMLSDDDIIQLLKSEIIEIGSHTLNHANLPSLNSDEKFHQINQSKLEFEAKFGINCTAFAYPFGFFDNDSVKCVEKSKFSCATTTVNSVFTPRYSKFEIPRIMISGRQGILSFILKIKKGRSR